MPANNSSATEPIPAADGDRESVAGEMSTGDATSTPSLTRSEVAGVKGVKKSFLFANLYMSSVFLQVFDQEYLLVFFIFFVSAELNKKFAQRTEHAQCIFAIVPVT